MEINNFSTWGPLGRLFVPPRSRNRCGMVPGLAWDSAICPKRPDYRSADVISPIHSQETVRMHLSRILETKYENRVCGSCGRMALCLARGQVYATTSCRFICHVRSSALSQASPGTILHQFQAPGGTQRRHSGPQV